jgi:hypothetical protein
MSALCPYHLRHVLSWECIALTRFVKEIARYFQGLVCGHGLSRWVSKAFLTAENETTNLGVRSSNLFGRANFVFRSMTRVGVARRDNGHSKLVCRKFVRAECGPWG